MQPTSQRWKEITRSEFPRELEALAFVRDHLPDHEPYRAWANSEFIADEETEAWPAARLMPLLAGRLELRPWIRQCDNDLDATTRLSMGDYFAQFLHEEAHALGVTLDDLRRSQPASPVRGRAGGRRTTTSRGRR